MSEFALPNREETPPVQRIECWECPPDAVGKPRCNLSGRCPVAALPVVAAVIADADRRRVTAGDPTEPEPLAMQARELLVRCRELEATVARVRGLVEWNKRMAGRYQANGTVIANDLTQALDGEPQP